MSKHRMTRMAKPAAFRRRFYSEGGGCFGRGVTALSFRGTQLLLQMLDSAFLYCTSGKESPRRFLIGEPLLELSFKIELKKDKDSYQGLSYPDFWEHEA